jgi:hypothetical protein
VASPNAWLVPDCTLPTHEGPWYAARGGAYGLG